MIIGVPKEIKNSENRVAITPAGVKKISKKHKVIIETGAGVGSGFIDAEYKSSGAEIKSHREIWKADMIVKVKEPLIFEFPFLKENQILFTYLHLAGADPELTKLLLRNKVTAVAYETVTNRKGQLPLLIPMSSVAGKMAVQVGTEFLAKYKGGRGILLDGIYNVSSGTVVIIGAGTVGQNAAHVALARGANTIVINRSKQKLIDLQKWAKKMRYKNLKIAVSTESQLKKYVPEADILIGAVLTAGHKASKVISESLVKKMKKGSVIVDVAIDQGGCIATSRPTSHKDPVYIKHNVVHYCVTNMPGAYPKTSTIGLTNETLQYIIALANDPEKSIKADKGLAAGVNTYKGFITNKGVANALKMEYKYRAVLDLIR